jgi:hypothetical protein
MFKSVSHRACLCKNRDRQPLALEFISAAGKGGMAPNVQGLANCGYSLIRLPDQPETEIFFLKFKIKIFVE